MPLNTGLLATWLQCESCWKASDSPKTVSLRDASASSLCNPSGAQFTEMISPRCIDVDRCCVRKIGESRAESALRASHGAAPVLCSTVDFPVSTSLAGLVTVVPNCRIFIVKVKSGTCHAIIFWPTDIASIALTLNWGACVAAILQVLCTIICPALRKTPSPCLGSIFVWKGS